MKSRVSLAFEDFEHAVRQALADPTEWNRNILTTLAVRIELLGRMSAVRVTGRKWRPRVAAALMHEIDTAHRARRDRGET